MASIGHEGWLDGLRQTLHPVSVTPHPHTAHPSPLILTWQAELGKAVTVILLLFVKNHVIMTVRR